MKNSIELIKSKTMDQITATMRELHISGMASAWERMRETRKYDSLTFTEG